MKKKYVIELEESYLKSKDVWSREKYPAPGAYLNTDESGIKAIVIAPENENHGVLGLYDFLEPNSMLSQFLGEPLTEVPELPEAKLEELPEIQTGVSESALLKAIAVAQKPELIINLFEAEE